MTQNFKEGRWNHEINVTDFVKTNITPYYRRCLFPRWTYRTY